MSRKQIPLILNRSAKVLLPFILIVAHLSCEKKEPMDRPQIQETKKSESVSSKIQQQRHTTVSFQRSKYASTFPSPAAGSFDLPETAEERELALAIIRRLELSWGDGEAVRDLMAEARLLETNAILRVAEKLMDHPDEDIRAEALMLADGAGSTAAMKLFTTAMGDTSPDIRRLAMETAQQLIDPSTRGLIETGLGDVDQGVRQLAFHLAMNQQEEIRQEAIVYSLSSPTEDLALVGMVEAEATPSKALLPKVIEALSHPSLEVRESAHEMLALMFHETFENAELAKQWWRENSNQYDDDLVFSPQ